jgi:hypothetical protein
MKSFKQMITSLIESFESSSQAAIHAQMTPSLLAHWRVAGLPLKEILMPNHIKRLVEEAQKRGCKLELEEVIEAARIMRFGGKKDA